MVSEKRRLQNKLAQRRLREKARLSSAASPQDTDCAGELTVLNPELQPLAGPMVALRNQRRTQSCPVRILEALSDEDVIGRQRRDSCQEPYNKDLRRTSAELCSFVEPARFDQLGHTISFSFGLAIATNAQRLGINRVALVDMVYVRTPIQHNRDIDLPRSLDPVLLQYQLIHDPIIDTIPHPRFRCNMLKSLSLSRMDPRRLSQFLRQSGGIISVLGEHKRCGLVVWGSPEDLSNWELTEAFVLLYGFLLDGCEDWINISNAWRLQRGEPPLPALSSS